MVKKHDTAVKIIFCLLILALLMLPACRTKRAEPKKIEGFRIVIAPEDKEPAETENAPANKSSAAEKNKTAQLNQSPKETAPKIDLEEAICDESATLGYISCSYKGKDLLLILRNSGKTNLDGVVYRFYDKYLMDIGESQEIFEFNLSDQKDLVVPLSSYDETYRIDIHPVQTRKLCGNKQIVLIPSENCR